MVNVCIIGAGPAGSVAGCLLARRDIHVQLIEQHRFPREKVCGECVSALGWQVLERCGLAERMNRAGAVRMRRGIIHSTSGGRADIELPGGMWGISRGVFDLALLEAAREAGVNVLQPARVEGHGRDAHGTSWVRVRDLQNNSIETIDSEIVMLADGKGASKAVSSEDFGIKAHFEIEGCAREAVQLFGVRGCYGGVAPIEGGLFNIACSVPRERIERCRDVEAVFLEMVGENRGLAEVMGGARRVSPWLAAPLPRFGVRRDWPAGVIPIGNAAAALEPIGGEGMGLALRSAEMAAEAILSDSDLSVVQRKLQKEFAELWRWRRMIWRGVAMMVSRPILCELAVEVMSVTNIGELVLNRAKEVGSAHPTINEASWGK
jgi:menaquinone-9 beta-reductase